MNSNVTTKTTMAVPSVAQLIVDVDDAAMLNDIRRAIKMIKGVNKISVVKAKKKSLDMALDDEKEGRVTEWNCGVDEMLDNIMKG